MCLEWVMMFAIILEIQLWHFSHFIDQRLEFSFDSDGVFLVLTLDPTEIV